MDLDLLLRFQCKMDHILLFLEITSTLLPYSDLLKDGLNIVTRLFNGLLKLIKLTKACVYLLVCHPILKMNRFIEGDAIAGFLCDLGLLPLNMIIKLLLPARSHQRVGYLIKFTRVNLGFGRIFQKIDELFLLDNAISIDIESIH